MAERTLYLAVGNANPVVTPKPAEPLNPTGGGGTSDNMPEDALKPRVDFLQTAFLWLAGALLTVIVAAATMSITSSNASNARIDKVGADLSVLNRQVGEQSSKVDEANRRLERIETKLDRLIEKK